MKKNQIGEVRGRKYYCGLQRERGGGVNFVRNFTYVICERPLIRQSKVNEHYV